MAFWKRFFVFCGAIVLMIILMNWVVMPLYVKHNTLVKVPSVVGENFEDAKKNLDQAGLEGLQGDIRYDPSKPIGTVLDQNPPAEQMVKDGRRIYLVVSGGEQLYDVPNLVGRSEREAKFMLGQRNLELFEVENKSSAQYPAGIVMSQVEQTGSKVKKGTKIGVVISAGMETGDLKVPDLVGKNVEDAKKLIMQSKLAIGKINFQPSTTVPLNAVIDQYPKANTMTKENQKIDIFVNREIKKKADEQQEEMNSMDEIQNNDKNKDKLKDEGKDNIKKDDKKKDDKPKPDDKNKPADKNKQIEKPKPSDKDVKKNDKPKKDKDTDGTNF